MQLHTPHSFLVDDFHYINDFYYTDKHNASHMITLSMTNKDLQYDYCITPSTTAYIAFWQTLKTAIFWFLTRLLNGYVQSKCWTRLRLCTTTNFYNHSILVYHSLNTDQLQYHYYTATPHIIAAQRPILLPSILIYHFCTPTNFNTTFIMLTPQSFLVYRFCTTT